MRARVSSLGELVDSSIELIVIRNDMMNFKSTRMAPGKQSERKQQVLGGSPSVTARGQASSFFIKKRVLE